MKKKSEKDILNERIILLENKQTEKLKVIREQFHIAYESLKPINVIKDVFHEVASSSEIKNDIVSNVIGLTTGYLSKKILLGSTHNPIKKIMGNLLQFAIANVASKHAETIKSAGENILQRILKYRKDSKQEFHSN
jgi:hypothetical protein